MSLTGNSSSKENSQQINQHRGCSETNRFKWHGKSSTFSSVYQGRFYEDQLLEKVAKQQFKSEKEEQKNFQIQKTGQCSQRHLRVKITTEKGERAWF